ncbi:hypothetical protein PIB30_079868 [Stylosanthes scabra]|uniref:Putative plant transposon protein domain-containing protein n=1 Tax=Stylosanthes scabra TaxID=79078 RepID=A0ABU6XTT5_9FABA|nr:hypothetical protein [Stylosanthes scabra]
MVVTPEFDEEHSRRSPEVDANGRGRRTEEQKKKQEHDSSDKLGPSFRCLRTSNILSLNLFEEIVYRKKVTPEVSFDLEDEEYPAIRKQIALRGWRRLASPRTKISKLLIQEFYANVVQTDEEMEQAGQHPYKSNEQTPEVETDYAIRQRTDQRLDEVLPDLCIPGATWKIGSDQPAQPIQLRRAKLTPLARGWHEFIIHSIIPTSKRSKITIARAILIHLIIKGKDVRAEELIADNIAVIAQGMQGKGKLAFPRTIYKLCKDAQVPFHEFRRTELIPQDKLITARLMETTRLGRNVQIQQQQNKEEEDQPMPQFEGGNEEGHDQGQHQHFE